MTVGLDAIKDLRERTGAGIVDCKQALAEASGSVEEAITILRKKGAAKAGKKSARQAKEGLVGTALGSDGRSGVLVELNCETDFVARNEQFQELVQDFANEALAKQPADTEAFLSETFKDSGQTVSETVVGAVARIGENIQLSRVEGFWSQEEGGVVHSYIHLGGKIGVLIELNAGSADAAKSEAVANLAKDLAMQIAARTPQYVDRSEVPESILANEKEIIEAGLAGKPPEVLDKIVTGKLEKFYQDTCFVDQAFVKDEGQKIHEVIAGVAKETGTEVSVKKFARFQLGDA